MPGLATPSIFTDLQQAHATRSRKRNSVCITVTLTDGLVLADRFQSLYELPLSSRARQGDPGGPTSGKIGSAAGLYRKDSARALGRRAAANDKELKATSILKLR